jgi:hypothetical protein
MAVELLVSRVRRDAYQYLPGEWVDQVVRECGIKWRDRLLTPLVTLRLFLLQVLHGNTAINHLRHLSGLGFSASAYCEARGRLKVEVIKKLLEGLVSLAKQRVGTGEGDRRRLPGSHLPGRVQGRVLVVDGSSFTTADTPELREHFGLYPGAREGVGYRTTQVTLATTLMDEQAWPGEQLAELYGLRWEIEGCFDHLKTTMKMNVLRCQSVDGVMKELAMYLLAYNLIRLEMLRAGRMQAVAVGRVSFIDALRRLCAHAIGLTGVDELIINPLRPGRWSPRVVRGRMKAYDLMTRPRATYKPPAESAKSG